MIYNGEFQSLIGRLQTTASATASRIPSPFQSLIGRLQTYSRQFLHLYLNPFQSLIGRLQTVRGQSYYNLTGLISIPHR